MRGGTSTRTNEDGDSPNHFERDKPGTAERSQAEAAIESVSQQGGVFVNAVRATRMPMVLTDPNLPGNPIVFANDAFLKLSGYRMDEVLGQQPHFMNGPETGLKDAARFTEAIRADQDDIIETVQYRKCGSRFVATVLISGYKDEKGHTLNHFMSWLDVTRRADAEDEVVELHATQSALRKSEERLAADLKGAESLQALSGQLIKESDDRFYEQIVDTAMAIMHADFGSLQMFDERENVLRLIAWRNFHPEAADYWKTVSVSTGTSCGFALQYGERVIIPDVAKDEHLRGTQSLRCYEISNIKAVQSTPLSTRDGSVIGMISTHWKTPHAPADRELRLFDILARQAADFVDRTRAEQALRESEARFRMLFETMGQGYSLNEIVRDVDGRAIDMRYLELNPAFERLTGTTVAVARGKLAGEVFPGLDHYWVNIVDHAVATGAIERVEHELTPNGRWYQSNFYPIGGDLCLSLYDDISDRKRAEMALRESEERQAFLLKLSDALRPLNDPIAVQDLTARLLGEELSADRCYYAEFDWPRDTLTISREYIRSESFSAIGEHPISSFRDLLQFSHKGEPLICDNIAEHPIYSSEIAAYRERKTDSFILMPLVKQGTMVACMCVTMESPRHWLPREVEIVRETADRTWAALERARTEVALRQSERHSNILLAELQHRVRNTLAVVRSIARRTAETTTTAEDMLAHFQGRLDAFSRVQSALTRRADSTVDLTSLIEDELIAHAAREGPKVRIEGPAISLKPRTAERLSLAVHELTTNAVKHGALANGTGRIRIKWRIKTGEGGGQELDFSWTESGLDLSGHKFEREGFGMELLRRSLPYDLNATTEAELQPGGLVFKLRMPLDAKAA